MRSCVFIWTFGQIIVGYILAFFTMDLQERRKTHPYQKAKLISSQMFTNAVTSFLHIVIVRDKEKLRERYSHLLSYDVKVFGKHFA